jgi:hypothetical protein
MRRALLLVWLLAVARPAAAATFVSTSVEEVARSADAVVRGRVVSTAARVIAGGRKVVTDVELVVDSAWKGAPGPTVRVVVPGGRTPTLGMWVDAAPTFTPGEEVVVFLGRQGDAWWVMGYALGKYHVQGGTAAPALDGAHVLARPLPAGERASGPMSVGELERRVRGAR